MLLVEANAGTSLLHRLGLIARQFIPKGTVIWEFRPEFDCIFTEDQLTVLSRPSQSQVLYYAYYDKVRSAYILSSDDDRFTNHSDNPNTQDKGDIVIAARDIREGEEITADYRVLGVVWMNSGSELIL